jgi:GTPase SAR1 family protein
LDSNQLTELPPAIAQLTNLQRLWLNSNQLTELPPELGELANLKELSIGGNEDLKIPPEILQQEVASLLAYLRRLKGAPREWVSKMLVVCEGGVGKTSLLRALRGEKFIEGLKTTHGIETGALALEHPRRGGVTMQLNTWDFGGQEIYHATHQFFLTTRSLYVLVWNARMGHEQCKLNYWLDMIEARAPKSPIIIVATNTEERQAGLPLQELKDKYENIVSHFSVSNETGDGTEELKEAIRQQAANLPLMGEQWPADWLEVRQAIRRRAKRKKHVTPGEFSDLMTRHKVSGIEERTLTRALHELGEILYFQDSNDTELSDTVVLDTQWVTKTISLVLESKEVKEGEGLFKREHMNILWRRVEQGMREHMLRLMQKFDLSYRTLDDKDISIVVERLSFDPPKDLEEKWNGFDEPYKELSMKFVLDKTMPPGVPTWFIARAHRFTMKRHWRYGALFASEDGKHKALVRAFPHDRYLELRVRGTAPQNFQALLRDGLEFTLNRFEGLGVRRWIPCPCREDGEPCGFEFELARVEKALAQTPPVESLQCQESYQNVPISKLLFGIDSNMTYRKMDELIAITKESRDDLKEIQVGLAELTELVQRDFTKLFNSEQSRENTSCPNLFILRGSTREGGPIGLFEPIKSPGMLDKIRDSVWKQQMELQLFCQEPGCWHPLGYERGRNDPETGLYQIEVSSDFLKTVAPYLVKLVKALKYAQPVAGPFVSWADPARYEKQFKVDIEQMKKLTEGMSKSLSSIEESREDKLAGALGGDDDPSRASGATLRALRLLLEEKDKQRTWGGLRRLMTKEGHWLWLCEHHAAGYRD